MSQVSVRAVSMWPISLLCHLHHTYRDYTCSLCGSSCVVFAGADAAEPRKKKKKNPPAGHHFHWQLVNKLKKRDAGTIPPPPPFSSLYSPPLLLPTQLVLSQKKKKKNFLEVMDFSGAGIGGRDISLPGCAQRWFSPPFNSIHTFSPLCSPLIGMEKGISRDRLVECFCFLDLIQRCARCQDTKQKCSFFPIECERKNLKNLKVFLQKRTGDVMLAIFYT